MTRMRFMKGLGTCAVVGALALTVGCAPQAPTSVEKNSADTPIEADQETAPDKSTYQGYLDIMQQRGEDEAPLVRTLEDGTQIQRTPDSGSHEIMFPDYPSAYNTHNLNADERGCDSCHTEGLRSVVENLDFLHLEVSNGLGTEMTPMDCRYCHNEDVWTFPHLNSFGSLIHGIHSDNGFDGNCMTCHDATADGNGLRLWEEARYDVLWGITPVADADLNADISYEQDTLTDMYTVTWGDIGRPTNDVNFDKSLQNEPLDPEVFDSWTLKVSGLVDNPFEMTLPEVIEEAPSETFVGTTQCDLNWLGGELIANVEMKGVPLTWFLEKAGVQDNAQSARVYSIDGSPSTRVSLDNADEHGHKIYLVYEINGERIDWTKGYPVVAWNTNGGLPIRYVSEIVVQEDPYEQHMLGWEDGEVDPDSFQWKHKPNVGILHFRDGQIIEAGQPYEFEGYAQAYEEQIVAVEFSLDRGETWTRLDTSDSDKTKWVYWHFNFTPPAEPGAYVLQVRAITDSGMTSATPDEVMFNAK